jgi:hypothetical protein
MQGVDFPSGKVLGGRCDMPKPKRLSSCSLTERSIMESHWVKGGGLRTNDLKEVPSM